MSKSYSKLMELSTFKERFNYLRLSNMVGQETFGYERYLNQVFYKSPEWRSLRNQITMRDNGCDLGIEGHEIFGHVYIHHINPITPKDIRERSGKLFDPENLICVSHKTHNAIHYGDDTIIDSDPIIRSVNDTCPWKK